MPLVGKMPLGGAGGLDYAGIVSATELIRQVAALPQQEQTLFEQLYRSLKDGNRAPGLASQSNWPDFAERLRDIYGDKIAADSSSIIDEGRSDR